MFCFRVSSCGSSSGFPGEQKLDHRFVSFTLYCRNKERPICSSSNCSLAFVLFPANQHRRKRKASGDKANGLLEGHTKPGPLHNMILTGSWSIHKRTGEIKTEDHVCSCVSIATTFVFSLLLLGRTSTLQTIQKTATEEESQKRKSEKGKQPQLTGTQVKTA